jgi:hypothetical protein
MAHGQYYSIINSNVPGRWNDTCMLRIHSRQLRAKSTGIALGTADAQMTV